MAPSWTGCACCGKRPALCRAFGFWSPGQQYQNNTSQPTVPPELRRTKSCNWKGCHSAIRAEQFPTLPSGPRQRAILWFQAIGSQTSLFSLVPYPLSRHFVPPTPRRVPNATHTSQWLARNRVSSALSSKTATRRWPFSSSSKSALSRLRIRSCDACPTTSCRLLSRCSQHT
jgi:hypothetical protein